MHGTRGIPGLICIAGFTALVALTAFAEPWTTWRNALAPMGWKGPELTLARMMELTPHEIARNVHAHPTLSEAIMEAAHGADGSPIHI